MTRRTAALAGLSALILVACGVVFAAPPPPSSAVAIAGAPGAPPSVTAIPGNASATVSWRAPSAGASPITHYVVTPITNYIPLPSITVGAVTSVVVTGLKNAKTYGFLVVASNARGAGPGRFGFPVTIGTPSPPTVVADFTSPNLTVRWTTPAADNGSAIAAYLIHPFMHGIPQPVTTVGPTASSAVFSALTPGTTYTFTVAALNAVGPGPESSPSPAVLLRCVGVPMPNGQADIDAAPPNTTFCLSGTHNWTLNPKSGDQLIGPAILDGGDVTQHAIVATAPNVNLSSLTIQHYNNGNGSQDGAIHIDDNAAAKASAANWALANLNVGFNSASGSGAGTGWKFSGGRFHDNHQEGIGGAVGDGVVVNGVEIDHNNFTDSTYKTRNWSCGDEAGGFKWVTNNVTVKNSSIHDNACKGLWADLNANGAVITNNTVFNNWDEGIFIEISSGATITDNTVTNNGFGGGSGCKWLWGGGITLASSNSVMVSHNYVVANCNGITGTQQDRPDGSPGLLQNINIQLNVIQGSGTTGVAADNGADLTTRSIVFWNNTWGANTARCYYKC